MPRYFCMRVAEPEGWPRSSRNLSLITRDAAGHRTTACAIGSAGPSKTDETAGGQGRPDRDLKGSRVSQTEVLSRDGVRGKIVASARPSPCQRPRLPRRSDDGGQVVQALAAHHKAPGQGHVVVGTAPSSTSLMSCWTHQSVAVSRPRSARGRSRGQTRPCFGSGNFSSHAESCPPGVAVVLVNRNRSAEALLNLIRRVAGQGPRGAREDLRRQPEKSKPKGDYRRTPTGQFSITGQRCPVLAEPGRSPDGRCPAAWRREPASGRSRERGLLHQA